MQRRHWATTTHCYFFKMSTFQSLTHTQAQPSFIPPPLCSPAPCGWGQGHHNECQSERGGSTQRTGPRPCGPGCPGPERGCPHRWQWQQRGQEGSATAAPHHHSFPPARWAAIIIFRSEFSDCIVQLDVTWVLLEWVHIWNKAAIIASSEPHTDSRSGVTGARLPSLKCSLEWILLTCLKRQ